jgi:glycosyltransferase involved in cell wall biosynthesis
MKISVIIPTYNRASFLEKTIESVLNQTKEVDELIVIDDGSSDNTQEIVKKYNIKYIYQENNGVSSARNCGIKNAKNDWICFLDSDDIWELDKISIQSEFHKNNTDILFSYSDERWFYKDKEVNQKKHQQKSTTNHFLDHIKLCIIGTSSVMCHKSIFDSVGVFDESFRACEDYDLWLRILLEFKVGFIDKKLINKIAGHKGQLSFETIGLDYYRILALQKHLKSEYNKEIKEEIKTKKEILLRGAIKHKNQFFIDFCNKI